MTTNKKYLKLRDKFQDAIWESGNTITLPMLKQVTLIAVNEILEAID